MRIFFNREYSPYITNESVHDAQCGGKWLRVMESVVLIYFLLYSMRSFSNLFLPIST